MRRQRALGPWDSRAPVRRTKHGLTPAEVDALIAAQGGCAICHRTDAELQLDHDHRHCPGRIGCRHCVRGAVCHDCNMAIHYVADNPGRADELAAYLRRTAA